MSILTLMIFQSINRCNDRTGATGYVGGEVLYQIANHDNLNDEITCLVRGDDKIAIMQKAFPQVRVVKGDLDDLKTIEEESKTADIVLRK